MVSFVILSFLKRHCDLILASGHVNLSTYLKYKAAYQMFFFLLVKSKLQQACIKKINTVKPLQNLARQWSLSQKMAVATNCKQFFYQQSYSKNTNQLK